MFENMIEKAKGVAGVACSEMEKITNISSLKLHKINLNRKLSQAYEDLGRVVFLLHKNNVSNDQNDENDENVKRDKDDKKVENILEKIEKLSNELQSTNEKIDDIKNFADANRE